jgi:hypothetical protein
MSRRIRTFTLLRNRSSNDLNAVSPAHFRRITTLLLAALVAVAAIAAVSALASSSSPTFETATEPFTNLECAHPSTQFTRVTSPVREGAYAAKFTESPSDVWSNGSVRCLATKYDSGETTGDDYYYHVSIYIPSNGLTSNLIWELHHPYSMYSISGACSVAPHAVLTNGTKLYYRLFTGDCTNDSRYAVQNQYDLLSTYPRNTWIDFVIHIRFAEASTGTLQVYYRTGSNPWPASPQVNVTGVPTMPYSSLHNVHNVKLYWCAGLYPGYSNYSNTDTLYMDDVRRETSLSAAEGGGVTETPPPAPSPVAPANTALPQVSGTAQVGQSLTATTGTWSGSPTSYSYQWEVSSDGGTSWAAVPGATAATLAETSAVQDDLARVAVTATNGAGSATATSAAVGPIAAAPSGGSSVTSTAVAPANTSLPQVSGTMQVGQTLTTTSGTWSGSPSIAYQWQYSRDSGATWLNVNGATATIFQESSTFQGAKIRVRTTASNSVGSATVASAAVGPVAASTTVSGSFSVATNLVDGQVWKKKKIRAIQWTATTSIAVASVEFWVDGSRGWTDTSAPYAYGTNGLLDLVPLTAGSHVLVVKAIAADGRVASKQVTIAVA